MRIQLIAVSNRQPQWVDAGYTEYAKRLRGALTLDLKELPLARRTPTRPAPRAVSDEDARMLAAIPKGAHVVALSEAGSPWSTQDLVSQLDSWLAGGSPVCLLIGGPDGLGPGCTQRANVEWSLSSLTLPHGLVKIVVAEALYRAYSILQSHPYHRC